ncbi:flagellar hook-associated protein FlgL [Thalassomonas sp. RHCl1]|uniref:flagellar hook-associated protein FlgL n=1 Tax=Thalassomonas sp. RHCl1 TaxID=2995320 RepID=UPI00248B6D3B|nr:flagellar hook-associated protein FlgL [Thalassomonas sp. RHCl1]
MMRVSTSQFYQFSTNNMGRLQSDVTKQTEYLSTGKQVLTAKDAPVGNLSLLGFKEELMSIERFNKNITQAESRNNRQEVALSNAQDILLQVKDIVIQANNGSYSEEEFTSLAQQLNSSLDQLLDVGNTKSESGEYIFAGYQTQQRPFSIAPDNSVSYSGDNGQSDLQIAQNIYVPINQAGDDVFMLVDNIVGDFMPTYTDNLTIPVDDIDPEEPDIYVERAVVVDRETYNGAGMTPGFQFDFADDGAGGIDVTVTDANGAGAAVYGPATYTAGQAIAFNGMEVNIDGNPLPGDQFTLNEQDKVSIYDTLKDAIDWVDAASTNLSDPKQHQVDYNHIITQLDEAFSHITNQRAEVGTTLKTIDTQRNIALDTEVLVNSSRGKIEDLDFAEAISVFEQQKLSLQAAQQTFSQIQGLSLFNFI